MYLKENQADIRLWVYDAKGNKVAIGDGNSWATYDGADLKASSNKTRPGGMGYEVELGGPATRSDATITIQNSDTMVGQHGFLEDRVSRSARAEIVVTFLDDEGVALPSARFHITGKILQSSLPGMKFDSGAQSMYTVMLGADERRAS